MTTRCATSRGRSTLLNRRQINVAQKHAGTVADRLTPRGQVPPRQRTREDPALAYGCVDWYSYPKRAQSGNETHVSLN